MITLNRPLSNFAKTKEQSWGWEDKFSISFVQTKKNANLSSQPRLRSFVLTQFEIGLLTKGRLIEVWVLAVQYKISNTW